MTKLIESQMKRHREQIEFGKEEIKHFWNFKKKKWRHHLEIAKTFASPMNNSQ